LTPESLIFQDRRRADHHPGQPEADQTGAEAQDHLRQGPATAPGDLQALPHYHGNLSAM
jgi:hypothetical protein